MPPVPDDGSAGCDRLDHGEPGSLVGAMSSIPKSSSVTHADHPNVSKKASAWAC